MVKDTLKHLANEKNTTIAQLLIETVNRTGSINRAARELGVANNAIRYQMNRLKLIAIRKKERTELVEGDES